MIPAGRPAGCTLGDGHPRDRGTCRSEPGRARRCGVRHVGAGIGTGTAGYSDREVNDPYGLVIGPDRALYFCDLGNQRIRRLDLKTRRTTTIAGSGRKGFCSCDEPRS